jgi:hypothetical protein
MVIDRVELIEDKEGFNVVVDTEGTIQHYGWIVKVWAGNHTWVGYFNLKESAQMAFENARLGRVDLSQWQLGN